MCFTFHNLLKQPFGTSTARVHVQWWVVQRTTLLKLETSIYLMITQHYTSFRRASSGVAWAVLSFWPPNLLIFAHPARGTPD